MKRILKVVLALMVLAIAAQAAAARNLCARVAEIKEMPFWPDEPVNDAAYNAFRQAGVAALPCLIAKITDARKMHDPRSVPRFAGLYTRVGDVALFVLNDIDKVDFIAMLPARYRKMYQTKGMYAYFYYVQQRRNRVRLQRKLRAWYRHKYGKRAT